MRLQVICFTLILLFFGLLNAQPDTVRVVTYNVLNFPGNDYTGRIPDFATVVNEIQPDILVVQEMLSQTGVNYFTSQVLNNDYLAAPFNDGPDTDNAIFYRGNQFTLVSHYYISTALRDIAEYVLLHNFSGESIRIYSLHLKASQGSSNEQQRLAEVTILKNRLLNLPNDSNYLVVGDYNIYNSSESAFQHLMSGGTVLDPINSPGNWHNNSSFSHIHTQSPRTSSFGGGSTGGMDDRFDMILMSDELQDNYLSGSYTAFGNDGNHFNLAVNSGFNQAVPAYVADALHDASDHLPVYCDFVFYSFTNIASENSSNISRPWLFQNYPNPFNPSTTIEYFLPQTAEVELAVYNALGQKISTVYSGLTPAGTHRMEWQPGAELASGIYYLKLFSGKENFVRKIFLQR